VLLSLGYIVGLLKQHAHAVLSTAIAQLGRALVPAVRLALVHAVPELAKLEPLRANIESLRVVLPGEVCDDVEGINP
jgi:hypothetical protein